MSDYSNHPEAQEIIKELVSKYNFDKNFVIKTLQSAKKQDKILESMSAPAEFTWTWGRYKKLFLEEIRL